MTVAYHLFTQSVVLKHAGSDVGGVCLELTRRWVKAQLTSEWRADDTIHDWIQHSVVTEADGNEKLAGPLKEVIASQRARETIDDVAIDGLSYTSSAERLGRGTFTRFQGLRSREDVINHVMSTPGVYIYAARPNRGGGHAFSFDTRDPSNVAFFDPNQGEYIFTSESLENMRAWWERFWDASGKEDYDGKINYKRLYRKGKRELIKYSVPPTH